MKKEDAQRRIFAAWDALAAEEKAGKHSAAAFAMKMASEYPWRGSSMNERYDLIEVWLRKRG
jgi:hypothetical protein